MPRSAIPSTSAEAAVRAHFGLSQQELARYLGVSAGFITHLEAGRKATPAAQALRLTRLARLLPPSEGHGPP
ncbi:MAG: DNA-binding transcriptional regulator, XRE-family domain, partial [Hymenobacter sp.]|nr:DNA-binding transcriptional regulator, XRE-family domain [Hymenobacter sp.]